MGLDLYSITPSESSSCDNPKYIVRHCQMNLGGKIISSWECTYFKDVFFGLHQKSLLYVNLLAKGNGEKGHDTTETFQNGKDNICALEKNP